METHNVTKRTNERTKAQSGDAQCNQRNKQRNENTLFWTPLSIIIHIHLSCLPAWFEIYQEREIFMHSLSFGYFGVIWETGNNSYY